MAAVKDPNAALRTERVFPVSANSIFAAFENPEHLARWWGPKDFTNTFDLFEFQPGGRWVFVMHGPNGANYHNECLFREIKLDTKIVIDHVVQPLFTLTVTITNHSDKTHLEWVQEFESAEIAAKLRSICGPANEENLDRLQTLLASSNS